MMNSRTGGMKPGRLHYLLNEAGALDNVSFSLSYLGSLGRCQTRHDTSNKPYDGTAGLHLSGRIRGREILEFFALLQGKMHVGVQRH